MKLPKCCPLCGNPELKTETGIETTRTFRDGIMVEQSSMAPQRRLWCLGCDTMLYPDNYDPRTRKYSRNLLPSEQMMFVPKPGTEGYEDYQKIKKQDKKKIKETFVKEQR